MFQRVMIPLKHLLSMICRKREDVAYWLRGVVTPPQAQGAFLLIGLNSDDVVTYGVGYKCSDKMKVVSEFTSGTDSDGNDIDNDFSIRASYSF